MVVLELVIFSVVAYLLGSIPVGLLLGKSKGIDIRNRGSGNIGATNTFRVLGVSAGIVTLFLDGLKGALPVLLFPRLMGYPPDPLSTAAVLFGVCSFCGHVWPVFLRFKGGKGVATALGVLLALAPQPVGLAAVVALIVIAITRMVSVGSLVGTVVFLTTYWFFSTDFRVYMGALFIACVIVYRHKGNIYRLMQGKEHRL